MKKEEAVGSSSIRRFITGVYKVISFQVSELKARLLGARNESLIDVFEKGIPKETPI